MEPLLPGYGDWRVWLAVLDPVESINISAAIDFGAAVLHVYT